MSVLAQSPESPARSGDDRAAGGQRFLLHDVSWLAYLTIGRALGDRPALRLTFDRGTLELMTTSPEHEKSKKRLARLIETLAEEFHLPIETAGSMTFQRQDLERGLEPDDSFWIAHEPQVRGRLEWDPTRDPPPDLVVEIEVTRSALDRLGLYAALGVPEVWRFDGEAITVHQLQADGTYRMAERSPTFPTVPLAEVARFLQPNEALDYLGVIRSFRDWVRAQVGNAGA
jgi:Uma2 family endonuclease